MHERPDSEERLSRARERREPLLFVVDRSGTIVYEARENTFDQSIEFCSEPGRLRHDIASIARGLIESSIQAEGATTRSAFVAPGYLMRLRRLRGTGKDEDIYALILEPFRSRDTVRVASRRYALTKREHEILMLILEGATAAEISGALHLSEHTVQGYFKRLLKKTGARNRAAMVANVLGWNRNAASMRVGALRRPHDGIDGDSKS